MSAPPGSFGDLLNRYLKARDPKTSLRKFAESVKSSHGFMIDVINGRRRPPIKDVEKWADAFRLTGLERQQFLLAARSARAKGKSDSADYVLELESEVRRHASDMVLVRTILRSLVTLNLERGLPVPERIHKLLAKLDQRVDLVTEHD